MLKLINYRWLLLLMAVVMIAVSCDDDEEPESKKPVASFQFEVDEENFLMVNFENFSQNAVSYSWNFGDGSSASTEEDPSHTYEAGGTYQVTLTATGSDGSTHEKTESVTVTDPNQAGQILTGETSKTWKLLRQTSPGMNAVEVGSQADRNIVHWSLGSVTPVASRLCAMNDEFIFHADGKYVYETNGDYFHDAGDYGPFNNDLGETCQADDDENFRGRNNEDLSAWNAGEHTFEYNVSEQKLTLTGLGAFIAIQKVATEAEVLEPQQSVTYNVVRLVDSQVDTLILEAIHTSGNYWRYILVHYDNPADEPALVAAPVADFTFEFAPGSKTVAFTNISENASSYSWDFGDGQTSTDESPSHTYNADGKYEVTLVATEGTESSEKTITVFLNVPETEENDVFEDFSGEAGSSSFGDDWFKEATTLTIGAANPVTGETNLVGKYERGAGVGAHISNDLGYEMDLSSRNVFKMKVYFPSSNDYVTVDPNAPTWGTDHLTKTVAIKLQNSANPEPWTDQAEQKITITDDQLDEWVEVTFDFGASAAEVKYDRILIQLGGEGHSMTGTFYLTDLELQ